MLVGQHPRDVGQQPGAVERLDLDLDQEDATPTTAPTRPRSSGPAAGQQGLDVGAVGAVHRDAVAAGDEADDRVAGHRRAAAGELDPDVGRARRPRRPGRRCAPAHATRVGVVASARSSARPPRRPGTPRAGPRRAAAETWPSPIAAYRASMSLVAQLGGEAGQRLGGQQALQRQALLAHRPGDRVLAVLDRLLAALLGEPLPDLVARPRRS